MTAFDFTCIGPSLKRAFDLLNQYRVQTSIDNYGQVITTIVIVYSFWCREEFPGLSNHHL
jgi:hypothetical protein